MRTILVGDCHPDHVFELTDPDAPNEKQFEYDVARALACLYTRHRCIQFTGSFRYENRVYQPDLALVAKDLSHWYVVEVELLSHSLENHVLPQVRAFVYGEPQPDCETQLASRLEIEAGFARCLLHQVPKEVAVVANKSDPGWEKTLKGSGVQMISVSVYKSAKDLVAVEIEGVLEAATESLGFGLYSATDRSLRFPKGVRLPMGTIQLFDPAGVISSWNVVQGTDAVWATKEVGIPNLPNGEYIQVMKTIEGRLSLRRPTR